MSTRNKAQAIKKASAHVSAPEGHGSCWVIYAPWVASDPSGPSTECRATSYSEARAIRARCVARIALHYLGVTSEDALWCIESGDYPLNVRVMVNAALSKVGKA